MKNLLTLLLGLIIGALIMYFYCCNVDDMGAITIVKPRGVITEAEGKVLDKAFNTRHALISSEIVNRPDNRSSWWSLKDMRNYLNYAEKQSKEIGYKMDGVRVYLGAYPNKDSVIGYTTMFMVPTSSDIPQDSQKGGSTARAGDGGDVPGGDPLNQGSGGTPPPANYPQ